VRDVITIDATSKTSREINKELRGLNDGGKVLIKNPGAKHFIGAGITRELEIFIHGNVGYFVATMNHGASFVVEGDAGWFAGDNMTRGYLEIKGDVGDGCGQGIYGGTIIVRGDAGARTGEIMKNGTIIIGGDSNFMTGLYMMGGEMIILGDIASMAGESIVRGTIYVKGDVESLGKNARIAEITEGDEEFLKDILKRYDFPAFTGNFRKIVPIKKRFFYGHPTEEG
jgi:glutamate synthase domain-containing protein 3